MSVGVNLISSSLLKISLGGALVTGQNYSANIVHSPVLLWAYVKIFSLVNLVTDCTRLPQLQAQ